MVRDQIILIRKRAVVQEESAGLEIGCWPFEPHGRQCVVASSMHFIIGLILGQLRKHLDMTEKY